MILPHEQFKENDYVVCQSFISKELSNFLYSYLKMQAQVSATCNEKYGSKVYNNTPNLLGEFVDPQAPGDFSKYADVAFESLMENNVHKVEMLTGLSLVPTYSYTRLYTKGSELVMHKDRGACEISITLCLGYDSDYSWPMYVEAKPIYLEPGDCIVYWGQNVKHGRPVFEGNNHAQVFMHFNDVKGPHKDTNKFDNRPSLGLPCEFNKLSVEYNTEEYD